MKIVIPGGTGQVGNVLARAFVAAGHEVVMLSRQSAPSADWRVVRWDGTSLDGDWAGEIDGADVVLNLAGRSVDCRYSAENRRQIMASRVDSTRAVGAAIARAARPPRVWLNSSTATIYAHRYDAANDEATGLFESREPDARADWKFSVEVAKAWERTAEEALTPGTRKVLLRSAMIMSPDRGGIFDVLLRLVRFGLGGTAGSGRQYVSWIHDRDFVRAIFRLIEDESFAGPVNLAAPGPLPYAEFIRTLRKAWGTPIGLPATKWMLEIGAFFMRSETELVLKSRRVVPGRLLEAGFAFDFPSWREAAANLCRRWRSGESGLALDPEVAGRATADSWKVLPFVDGALLEYQATFDAVELERLSAGLVPEAMEDKWFIYYEKPYLHLHSSWTGHPVFRVTLEESASGAIVAEARRSPLPDRPLEGLDLAYEAKLLDFLVSNLLLRKAKPFPVPKGMEQLAPGIYQHVVSGTGYQEQEHPSPTELGAKTGER
jgi:uncharacterized protein (TIGR01777 family)